MEEEIILTEKDVPGAHFSEDPAEYSVVQLKRWLECHGEKRGERKQGRLSLE